MQKISLKKAPLASTQSSSSALAQVMAIKSKLTPKEFSELMNASTQVMNKDAWGRNAVLSAAAEGDDVKLKEVLGWGLDASELGFDQQGALELATQAGSLACVKLLIKAGVKPNKNLKEMSALEWAAQGNHVSIFKALVKAYPKETSQHSANVCAVVLCVGAKGIFDVLLPHIDWHSRCDLVLKGASNVWFKSEVHGSTAVSAAAIMGELGWLSEMIKAGAELDAPDMLGRSALELCCAAGKIDAVKVLLKAKAFCGQSWLMYDVKGVCWLKVKTFPSETSLADYTVPGVGIKKLRLGGTPPRAMLLALAHRHYSIAALLLKHGDNPLELFNGQTHHSANLDVMSEATDWIEKNADFSTLNALLPDGFTMLNHCIKSDRRNLKWLLDRGADPRVKNAQGKDSLELCQEIIDSYKPAGKSKAILAMFVSDPMVKHMKLVKSILNDKRKELDALDAAAATKVKKVPKSASKKTSV